MLTRHLFTLAIALVALPLSQQALLAQQETAPAAADGRVWHHASSLMGDPKYPPGFPRFDYVNPDAPKGGTVRLSDTGSFDTFNPILPQGETATGLGLVFESLMTPSLDENSVSYGLLAESFTYPDD